MDEQTHAAVNLCMRFGCIENETPRWIRWARETGDPVLIDRVESAIRELRKAHDEASRVRLSQQEARSS